MALPRSEQDIQKERSRLGVVYRDTVNLLVELCKGRVNPVTGKWFYELFLNRGRAYNQPTTILEAQRMLASAWWIEEEDIRQELLYQTLRLGLTSRSEIGYSLARNIREYLIYNQHLFSRSSRWEEDYTELQPTIVEKETTVPGLNIVFAQSLPLSTKYSLFDRYLIYLSCILRMSIKQIRDLLPLSTGSIDSRITGLYFMTED